MAKSFTGLRASTARRDSWKRLGTANGGTVSQRAQVPDGDAGRSVALRSSAGIAAVGFGVPGC
ncbi:MAG: hypothetical protein V5A55_08890 [Halovenus sp.]